MSTLSVELLRKEGQQVTEITIAASSDHQGPDKCDKQEDAGIRERYLPWGVLIPEESQPFFRLLCLRDGGKWTVREMAGPLSCKGQNVIVAETAYSTVAARLREGAAWKHVGTKRAYWCFYGSFVNDLLDSSKYIASYTLAQICLPKGGFRLHRAFLVMQRSHFLSKQRLVTFFVNCHICLRIPKVK